MKKLMLVPMVCAALAAAVAFGQEAAAEAPKVEEAKAEGAQKPERRARKMSPERVAEMRAKRKAAMGRAIPSRPFGKLADGTETKIWRLQGAGGLVLEVSDYGGRLVRAYAPDRHGNLADVTLGWNTAAEYEQNGFSMGTLIGRYGNRIADGKFTLDGKEYQLPINENKAKRHCNLHGGPKGWDTKVWNAEPFRRGPVQGIEFSLESPDGDMGFPGKVNVKVRYTVRPDNTWAVDYEATTDKPTVLNLTHHSYWNLAGEASGNVLGQHLQIFADEYGQVTEGLIPTDKVAVKGTPFDFRELRPIGAMAEEMKKDAKTAPMDHWYDHNFWLRGKEGRMKKAAFMWDPVSGRTLEISTTEPCMQMYGAQNMTGELAAKAAGAKLCQFAGVALETQHAPDSPNRSDFPSTVLRPGETFKSRTVYKFGVK